MENHYDENRGNIIKTIIIIIAIVLIGLSIFLLVGNKKENTDNEKTETKKTVVTKSKERDEFEPSRYLDATLFKRNAPIEIKDNLGKLEVSVENFDMFDSALDEDFYGYQFNSPENGTIVAIKVSIKNTGKKVVQFQPNSAYLITDSKEQARYDSFIAEHSEYEWEIEAGDTYEGFLPFMIYSNPKEIKNFKLAFWDYDEEESLVLDFDMTKGQLLDEESAFVATESKKETKFDNELGEFELVQENVPLNLEQKSASFKVNFNSMDIYKLELDDRFVFENPTFAGQKYATAVIIDTKVENTNEDFIDFNLHPIFITTNTKEQLPTRTFGLGPSENLGSKYIGEVIKEGKLIYVFKSKPEEVKSVKFYYNPPYLMEDYDEIGDAFVLEATVDINPIAGLDEVTERSPDFFISEGMGSTTVAKQDIAINQEKNAGPVKITLEKLDLLDFKPKKSYQKEYFDGLKNLTLVRVKAKIETNTDEKVDLEFRKATITSNTGDTYDLKNMFLLNNYTAYGYMGSIMSDEYIIFPIKTAASEITHLQISFGAPLDEHYKELGEKMVFEIDVK